VRTAAPQREPEHGEEDHAEPDARIGEQAVTEQRAGQPEQRHDRQVGVVLIGILSPGEHGGVRVGGALVDKGVAGIGDDRHLGLF
jgi:hypothetical protein